MGSDSGSGIGIDEDEERAGDKLVEWGRGTGKDRADANDGKNETDHNAGEDGSQDAETDTDEEDENIEGEDEDEDETGSERESDSNSLHSLPQTHRSRQMTAPGPRSFPVASHAAIPSPAHIPNRKFADDDEYSDTETLPLIMVSRVKPKDPTTNSSSQYAKSEPTSAAYVLLNYFR